MSPLVVLQETDGQGRHQLLMQTDSTNSAHPTTPATTHLAQLVDGVQIRSHQSMRINRLVFRPSEQVEQRHVVLGHLEAERDLLPEG